MQASRDELALWQQALSSDPKTAPGTCPTDDEIWRASVGEASPEQVRELVDHALTCSPCAVAWRLARQLIDDDEATTTAQPSSWRSWRSALAAMAAILVLAVGFLWQQNSGPSNLRNGSKAQISTSLAKGDELPREAFVLSWNGPQAGLRYDLRVTRENLEPVTEVQGIKSETSEVEYLIDAELLTDVPPGGAILWRIETTLPNGGHLASDTFVVRVK